MRIISEFYDYYDSIQRMGQDQTVLFVRKRVEIPVYNSVYFPYPNGKPGIVSFCGQLFPFVTTSIFNGVDFTVEHHYSPDKLKIDNRYQRQSIYRFFNEPSYFPKEYMEKHPVVVLHKGSRLGHAQDTIVVNENLSKIGFQKVVDPYTAFNQIHSFLSNIAQPRKPIPEITDEEKIQSHGFDKFSFRKEPTKKKKRA